MHANAVPDAERVLELVIQSTRAVLEQRGATLPDTIGRDTALFGQNGLLDSIGIVTLMVDIEQNVFDRFHASIQLADDRAMSQRSSPFRSVGALTDFILSLLNGGA